MNCPNCSTPMRHTDPRGPATSRWSQSTRLRCPRCGWHSLKVGMYVGPEANEARVSLRHDGVLGVRAQDGRPGLPPVAPPCVLLSKPTKVGPWQVRRAWTETILIISVQNYSVHGMRLGGSDGLWYLPYMGDSPLFLGYFKPRPGAVAREWVYRNESVKLVADSPNTWTSIDRVGRAVRPAGTMSYLRDPQTSDWLPAGLPNERDVAEWLETWGKS